jgi:cell division protein FtsQ
MRLRGGETTRFGRLARLGGVIGACLLFLVLGMLLWRSDWRHRQVAQALEAALQLTQKAHFTISDIVVEGREQTGKDQLFVALDTAAGSPILAFDPRQAEARIAKLPWVASAIVERRLPDTIFVRLVERAPLALWQRDNQVAVIDAEGKILPDASPDQFAQLPLLVGAGAAAEGTTLIDSLRTYPAVRQKMTAAVRVGERRWDLRLQPNVVARLPETDVTTALGRLSLLIADQKILERDIVAIDLRLPDRLIIEPARASSQNPVSKDNRL